MRLETREYWFKSGDLNQRPGDHAPALCLRSEWDNKDIQ